MAGFTPAFVVPLALPVHGGLTLGSGLVAGVTASAMASSDVR